MTGWPFSFVSIVRQAALIGKHPDHRRQLKALADITASLRQELDSIKAEIAAVKQPLAGAKALVQHARTLAKQIDTDIHINAKSAGAGAGFGAVAGAAYGFWVGGPIGALLGAGLGALAASNANKTKEGEAAESRIHALTVAERDRRRRAAALLAARSTSEY
jgi:hypothetical protein